ncbi:MAG TPA: sugar phosphate isomerase/epimerase family protein [Solirubrobacterales bacterium]|nr:sugar phosphate isomerase/epimerase family protein [Solirubrobacterales bacterium]
MAAAPDLLATCWTSAGDAAPGRGDEVSPIPLRARIEACAAAGWTGFGLLHADLEPALERGGPAALRTMFEDCGIERVELEFLGDWWTDGERRRESDRRRDLLLRAAEGLGAGAIKVGGELGGEPVDRDRFMEEFDRLATQAGEAGTRIALEPMPMSNVATIAAGAELVREVGNPHGGLCVDVWHVRRAGTSDEELRACLPIERVFVVELDDAATAVDPRGLWEDTIHRRLLPGEGNLDVAGFVRAMEGLGWRGHWGVEVISEQHRRRPFEEGIVAAHAAASSVI